MSGFPWQPFAKGFAKGLLKSRFLSPGQYNTRQPNCIILLSVHSVLCIVVCGLYCFYCILWFGRPLHSSRQIGFIRSRVWLYFLRFCFFYAIFFGNWAFQITDVLCRSKKYFFFVNIEEPSPRWKKKTGKKVIVMYWKRYQCPHVTQLPYNCDIGDRGGTLLNQGQMWGYELFWFLNLMKVTSWFMYKCHCNKSDSDLLSIF